MRAALRRDAPDEVSHAKAAYRTAHRGSGDSAPGAGALADMELDIPRPGAAVRAHASPKGCDRGMGARGRTGHIRYGRPEGQMANGPPLGGNRRKPDPATQHQQARQ